MRLYADAGEGVIDPSRYVEFLYTLKGNDYMFDFDINMVNMENIIPATSSILT